MADIQIIVAIAKNFVIGNEGQIHGICPKILSTLKK